jgi:hypothetical protein
MKFKLIKPFIKTSEQKPITERPTLIRLKKWQERVTDSDKNTILEHPTESLPQDITYLSAHERQLIAYDRK